MWSSGSASDVRIGRRSRVSIRARQSVSCGQVLACSNVVLQVRVSAAPEMVHQGGGEKEGVCLVVNRPIRASNRLQDSNAGKGMCACPTYRERQTKGQGGQGAGGGTFKNASASGQSKGTWEVVLSLQAQALEALKHLLGPEVTARLRARLSQKVEPPKIVEDKLAEKKRERRKSVSAVGAHGKHMTNCISNVCSRSMCLKKSTRHSRLNFGRAHHSKLSLSWILEREQNPTPADQPLPDPDGDVLAEPQDDSKRRTRAGDCSMDVDSQVTTLALVAAASKAADAIDIVEFRQLTGDRAVRDDCEAGLRLANGG